LRVELEFIRGLLLQVRAKRPGAGPVSPFTQDPSVIGASVASMVTAFV
jgi:hypothetical protein